jgi:hypothetical protein
MITALRWQLVSAGHIKQALDSSSKLVMRVRFPSSALAFSCWSAALFDEFPGVSQDERLVRRARCVPDRFGSVPVLPVFLASAKSLPMPAAIFRSR